MYKLKRLLVEDGKINRKKPFSLSKSDPYMYYWDNTTQSNNPAGGVWMSKLKQTTMDEPWYDLHATLTPSKYQAAAKKLWDALPSTAYQLDWSGEGDYSDINAAADADAKKNTEKLNNRLKSLKSKDSAIPDSDLGKEKSSVQKQSDDLTAASAQDKLNNSTIQKIVRDLYKVTTSHPELYFRRFSSVINDREQAASKHFNTIWSEAWSDTLKDLYAKSSGFDRYNIKVIKAAQQFISYKLINAGHSGWYNTEFYYIKNGKYEKHPVKFRWDYM